MDIGYYDRKGKADISIGKLVLYNCLFVIPLLFGFFISNFVGTLIADDMNVTPAVMAQILMMFYTLIFFFMLIPFIRMRENIRGVRFALFDFFVVGIVMSIPPVMSGHYNILFLNFIYIANFILATFINSPDVIGISGDLDDWITHKVQLMILLIYSCIVVFYILGFAWMYYELALANPGEAFVHSTQATPNYGDYLYYSIITFTTIGFGDVTPWSSAARLVTGLEALIGMIINVVFIAVLVVFMTNYQQLERGRRDKAILSAEKKIEKEERVIEKEAEELREEEKRIANEERTIEKDIFLSKGDGFNRSNSTISKYYPGFTQDQLNQRDRYK